MTNQVMIGAQVLHGTDRLGQWITEKIEGWDNPPGSKGDAAQREDTDGDYDLKSSYLARVIIVTVLLAGESRAASLAGLRNVAAAAQLTGSTLVVTDSGEATWARVKFTGMEPAWLTKSSVRFQLMLKAPDPRRFGELRSFIATTDASSIVHHKGNYWATPKFTVTGSMPGGYSIALAGRLFTVTRALTSSAPHTIDYRDGRLRVNGSLVTGGISASDTFRVEPGQRDTLSLTARTSGSGKVSAEIYDTYI